jgi:hypothetical protein
VHHILKLLKWSLLSILKPFIKKKKKENAPKTKVVPHKYFESHNSDAVCVHTAAAFGGGNIGDFPL